MSKGGFTLIELIVTIGVITVGILGTFTVCIAIINYTSLSSFQLTAAYLAQEGIEIVRNIRDTNLVGGADWDNGLGADNWEVVYNDSSLYLCPSPCNFEDLRFLKINGGFYNYIGATNTRFKRKIIIDNSTVDVLKVSVSVEWEYKGKIYGPVTAQGNLYNWY